MYEQMFVGLTNLEINKIYKIPVIRCPRIFINYVRRSFKLVKKRASPKSTKPSLRISFNLSEIFYQFVAVAVQPVAVDGLSR